MTNGYVVFRLAGQTFATALDEVREIVRLDGVEPLPRARPPLAGMLVVRGEPIAVLDTRDASSGATHGDVLVMSLGGDAVGVAVDQVIAVVSAADLPDAGPPSRSLPSYVVGLGRHLAETVLIVDMARLLDRSSEILAATSGR